MGYLFGFKATGRIAHNPTDEGVAQAYAPDLEHQASLYQSHTRALNAVAGRLPEAHARGLWRPDAETLSALQNLLAEGEGLPEGRGGVGG